MVFKCRCTCRTLWRPQSSNGRVLTDVKARVCWETRGDGDARINDHEPSQQPSEADWALLLARSFAWQAGPIIPDAGKRWNVGPGPPGRLSNCLRASPVRPYHHHAARRRRSSELEHTWTSEASSWRISPLSPLGE